MIIKATPIFYPLLILLLCVSCKISQDPIDKDIRDIVNITINEYDTIFLIEKTYYNDKLIKSINLLDPYYRAYSSNENTAAYQMLYKKVKNIISLTELNKIKEEHKSWSIVSWDKKYIGNSKVKFISLDSIVKHDSTIPTVRLSEPIFTKDKKKAIIYKSYLKNGTGAHGIQILVKERGKWVIKGGIPIGTSG